MPTALIVEDEPEANRLLSLLVGLRGYRAESAYTGGEAIQQPPAPPRRRCLIPEPPLGDPRPVPATRPADPSRPPGRGGRTRPVAGHFPLPGPADDPRRRRRRRLDPGRAHPPGGVLLRPPAPAR